MQPLIRHDCTTCTVISRTTLIIPLTLTNARQVSRHSGPAGHRAAYASYCWLWNLEWPLGGPAEVRFSTHDFHATATDVYPLTFTRRVDKCLQMTAGIVATPAPSRFKCAFPGRKASGRWLLEYSPKCFPGAHGSRHLCNMKGGKVYKVDMLFM